MKPLLLLLLVLNVILLGACGTSPQSTPVPSGQNRHSSPATLLPKQPPAPGARMAIAPYVHWMGRHYLLPANPELPDNYVVGTLSGSTTFQVNDSFYAASHHHRATTAFPPGRYLITPSPRVVTTPGDRPAAMGFYFQPSGRASWLYNSDQMAVLTLTYASGQPQANQQLLPRAALRGDRALPRYATRARTTRQGMVVSTAGQAFLASKYSSIITTLGRNNGIHNGMIIKIPASSALLDPFGTGTRNAGNCPSPRATALVYQTTSLLSLALVLDSRTLVTPGDSVTGYER